MPFAAAGAGIGVVGSMVGGGKQADAAKKAAKIQAEEADKAMALQQSQFNTEQHNIQPWLEAGKSALGTLSSQLPSLTKGYDQSFSFDPSSVAQDPAFQFAMQQGQQAIERSAAARGGALGGATLKALDQFGTGTAAQYENQDFNQALSKYQNAFNVFETNQGNAYNRLANVAGLGQTANNQLAQAGQHMADESGNYMTQSGNAQAAGIVGAANANASRWSGVSSALSSMPAGNPFSSSYWSGGSGKSGDRG